MAGLEHVVRPFQTERVSLPAGGPRRQVDAEGVVCHFVGDGNAKTFSFSFSTSVSGGGTKFKEVERTTKRVRIENPEDPNQFVEVDRVKKIVVGNEDDPKEKLTWTLKDTI